MTDHEFPQETKKDDVIRYLLLKKLKNIRSLSLVNNNAEEKYVKNFLSMENLSEFEIKLLKKNTSYVDSHDLNFEYFSESFAIN